MEHVFVQMNPTEIECILSRKGTSSEINVSISSSSLSLSSLLDMRMVRNAFLSGTSLRAT